MLNSHVLPTAFPMPTASPQNNFPGQHLPIFHQLKAHIPLGSFQNSTDGWKYLMYIQQLPELTSGTKEQWHRVTSQFSLNPTKDVFRSLSPGLWKAERVEQKQRKSLIDEPFKKSSQINIHRVLLLRAVGRWLIGLQFLKSSTKSSYHTYTC